MGFVRIVVIVFILMFSIQAETKARSWTDNWTLNGIPLNEFKTASGKDWFKFGGGIATSFTVHWLGHVIYLETHNINWEQKGFVEHVNDKLEKEEYQWVGRSGFIAQLTVGGILKLTKLDKGYFGIGYHIGSFLEIATYPLHWQSEKDIGDLNLIEKGGGNQNLEYGIYTISSILLMEPGRAMKK